MYCQSSFLALDSELIAVWCMYLGPWITSIWFDFWYFGTCQDVGIKTSINFDSNLYLQGLQQVWACVLSLHLYCHYLEMIRAQCLIGQHLPVFHIIKQFKKLHIIPSPPPPKLQNDVFWTKLVYESSLRIVLHCLQLFTLHMKLKLLQT